MKRIVDIGDVDELGCAGDSYGDVEHDALGDADMEAVGEDYVTRAECAQAFASASQGGFALGSLLGGLLGVGLGAAGAALVAHHFKVSKR